MPPEREDPDERILLAIDCTTAEFGVALLRGREVLAARHAQGARGQAEQLIPMIEACLAEAGLAWADVAALGVGVGPGNFTGVRLAVATARGIALARGLPAYGIGTFEALAEGHDGDVLAVAPAPRGHLHACRRHAGRWTEPWFGPADALPAGLAGGAKAVGSAAAGEAASGCLPAALLPPRHPPAVAIGLCAADRPAQPPPPRPAPVYLRPADAAPSTDAPPPLLDAAAART